MPLFATIALVAFSACGDETYGYNTNTKKVEKTTFVAQNAVSNNISNN